MKQTLMEMRIVDLWAIEY